MQIVIDIPDNTYADIQEHKRHTGFTILDLINAVRYGTALPKEHGRLIDADNLDDVYVAYDCNGILSRIDAPTVLEADNET